MSAQDFTTYTEVDPSSDLTVAASSITVSTCASVDAYVYYDFGADAFDALTVTWEMVITSSAALGCVGGISLSNVVDGVTGFAATDLSAHFNREAGGYRAFIYRGNLTAATATGYVLVAGTTYYCSLSRTAGNDIVTMGIYTDSGRTTHVTGSPLSRAGFGTVKWRYAHGFNNEAVVSYDGSVSNLDLNLPPTPKSISDTGSGADAAALMLTLATQGDTGSGSESASATPSINISDESVPRISTF